VTPALRDRPPDRVFDKAPAIPIFRSRPDVAWLDVDERAVERALRPGDGIRPRRVAQPELSSMRPATAAAADKKSSR
jgi:hypothetical protein